MLEIRKATQLHHEGLALPIHGVQILRHGEIVQIDFSRPSVESDGTKLKIPLAELSQWVYH